MLVSSYGPKTPVPVFPMSDSSDDFQFLVAPEQAGFPEEEKKCEYVAPLTFHPKPLSHVQDKFLFSSPTLKPSEVKGFKIHKFSIQKTARKVHSDLKENVVPSMSLDSAEFNPKMKAAIEEHAYMRIQLFALTSIALSGVAVASDPTKSRHVKVGIGHAYLQFGKGSKDFHAAHSNAAAGYTDDWKVVTIGRICDEKEITPKTLKILRCKGFTDEELEKLKLNSFNLKTVSECFQKHMPKESAKPDSLIAGTYLEQVLNSTVTLPKSVNLFVDKAIEEDLRPKMEKLYEEIMHGKLTAEAGCDIYSKAIKNRLNELNDEINNRISYLVDYQKTFKTVFNDDVSLDDKQTAAESLVSIYKKMRENKKFKVFNFLNMTENKLFISKLTSKVKLEKDLFQKFLLSMKPKETKLLEDAIAYHNSLKMNQEYCALENSGTIVPPFGHLYGTTDKKTLQGELLTRLPPATPAPKKRRVIAAKVGGED